MFADGSQQAGIIYDSAENACPTRSP